VKVIRLVTFAIFVAVVVSLEKSGVEFLDDGKPGVRLAGGEK
jgi:hypothetical protein